jgi:hypothetical protein
VPPKGKGLLRSFSQPLRAGLTCITPPAFVPVVYSISSCNTSGHSAQRTREENLRQESRCVQAQINRRSKQQVPRRPSSGHFVASSPGSTSRRSGRPQLGGVCRDDKSNSGARQNSRLFSPGYSFTWAKGICENNCRSMIMFSRRSSWKNVAAFLPGNTWLTVGTYFKRSACACPSTSSQCRT